MLWRVLGLGLLASFMVGWASLVFGQTAILLPNGMQQFTDNNGAPLVGGLVYFYTPGTTTPKTTWQDSAETIPNANPVTLDAAGRALLYGSGSYRQQVFDISGNLIWDAVTAAGFPSGSIALSSLASQANLTAVGNISGAPASPVALTAAQVTASLINDCTGTLAGRVPTPPNSTAQFLRGDCNFSTPPAAVAGGRLTLVTGTPVMTSSQTAKSTIFYDCFNTSTVPVYDGAKIPMLAIAGCEISVGLDATVPHVASGSLYDIFAVSNSGALALCVGPAWASSSTRGTGAGTTELTRATTGFYTNTNALAACWGGGAGLTNLGSVAANTGTYLGTFGASASGQTEFVFGSPGTAASLKLWNMYNRVGVSVQVRESAVTYTYTQTTWRAVNNGSVSRLTYVNGLNEDTVSASYQTEAATSGSGVGVAVGIGLSSVLTPTGTTGSMNSAATVSLDASLMALYRGYAGLGQVFLQALEALNGTPGTITFRPGDVANGALGGLSVDLRM